MLLPENKAKSARRGEKSERKGGGKRFSSAMSTKPERLFGSAWVFARSNLAHLCACAELDSGLSYWLAWAAQVDAPDSLNYSNLSLSTDVSPNLSLSPSFSFSLLVCFSFSLIPFILKLSLPLFFFFPWVPSHLLFILSCANNWWLWGMDGRLVVIRRSMCQTICSPTMKMGRETERTPGMWGRKSQYLLLTCWWCRHMQSLPRERKWCSIIVPLTSHISESITNGRCGVVVKVQSC